MTSRPSRILSILLPAGLALALPLAGCSSDEPTPAAETQATAAQAEGSPPAGGDSAGLAPVTSRESATTPASGETITAAGAIFDLPADWRSETPSSQMRLAQAAIPGEGGEGTLTVFHFGPGGGGGVDANLERWIGQMEATSEPTRETFDVDGGDFRVTWTEVQGTLKGGTMGGPAEAQPNSTLLGAVVEGAQGPWFFKILGPTDTLDSQRDAFLGMLRSVRKQ